MANSFEETKDEMKSLTAQLEAVKEERMILAEENQQIRVRSSLDSRPIKIRPGTYCMGDSAHALQNTQNMGNRTTNVKP